MTWSVLQFMSSKISLKYLQKIQLNLWWVSKMNWLNESSISSSRPSSSSSRLYIISISLDLPQAF